jgi:3-methyladenine DNA glycosylase/8-oxoguanine DNA glycosylase
LSELTIPTVGPAGEPVDLWRTLVSHGVADLPPIKVDEVSRTLTGTLPLPGLKPRTLVLRDGGGTARVQILGAVAGPRTRGALESALRRVLNLDEDLSSFYELAAEDAELAWVTTGAGRMFRSPSVFEEVIKTVATTNCAWAATVRMTTALVEHLGEPSAGGHGRAFPQPAAMAAADEAFYRDVVRAGYRGPYLRAIAAAVASGTLDLEELHDPELSDTEVAERLLALPGVGPYAAAHVMMLLGRYSSLVLDSWTRPKYARLVGQKRVADSTIFRRFRRYGRYAGLAFWLFLTRDWVPEPAAEVTRLSEGEPASR